MHMERTNQPYIFYKKQYSPPEEYPLETFPYLYTFWVAMAVAYQAKGLFPLIIIALNPTLNSSYWIIELRHQILIFHYAPPLPTI